MEIELNQEDTVVPRKDNILRRRRILLLKTQNITGKNIHYFKIGQRIQYTLYTVYIPECMWDHSLIRMQDLPIEYSPRAKHKKLI